MARGTPQYIYDDASFSHSHAYLLPALACALDMARPRRVFEVGCGNGAVGNWLQSKGFDVAGVDFSESGIKQANQAYPKLQVATGSAYDDLAAAFGTFPLVISFEVVEHLYFPRKFAKTVFDLLEPGGMAVISTPYHGYLKNLSMALTGRLDAHFTALWDGGHIKFWSERTLRALLEGAGFEEIAFRRVGRVRPLAKSMIATAIKPVR